MTNESSAPLAVADIVLPFSIPARDVRGRVVKLGPVLDLVLGAHNYPPAVKHVLAEAMVVGALMGSLLKDEGDQLTMQVQSNEGIIRLMVCDYRHGELRGYAQFDEDEVRKIGANPSLESLFDKAHLAITFDLASTGKRFQGIVPMEGGTLSSAVEFYFAQSEQIPTLIRTAMVSGPQGCVAGGLLVQHFPDGESGRERLHVQSDQPEWEHVAILASSLRHDELVDPKLQPEDIVWRLFHEEEEVRVNAVVPLSRGCRCTKAHFTGVLTKFPESELADMRNEDGIIPVDCAFCSKVFAIEL